MWVNTYNTKVARSINLQARIDDTAIFFREHRRRADGVEDRPAVGLHVLLEPRLPFLEHFFRGNVRADHLRAERRRLEEFECELDGVHDEIEVSGVREVVWVDRRRSEGIGGRYVHRPTRQRVHERAEERVVVLPWSEFRVWHRLVTNEVKNPEFRFKKRRREEHEEHDVQWGGRKEKNINDLLSLSLLLASKEPPLNHILLFKTRAEGRVHLRQRFGGLGMHVFLPVLYVRVRTDMFCRKEDVGGCWNQSEHSRMLFFAR